MTTDSSTVRGTSPGTPSPATPATYPARRRRRLNGAPPCRSAWPGKFYWEYAGEVPLVLKLNGKTDIPSPADPGRR